MVKKTETPITKEKGSLANFDFREKYWNEQATKSLVGYKIIKAEYIPVGEAKEMQWYNRPVSFLVEKGDKQLWIFPQMDDEGNDGGALAIGNDLLPTLSNS